MCFNLQVFWTYHKILLFSNLIVFVFSFEIYWDIIYDPVQKCTLSLTTFSNLPVTLSSSSKESEELTRCTIKEEPYFLNFTFMDKGFWNNKWMLLLCLPLSPLLVLFFHMGSRITSTTGQGTVADGGWGSCISRVGNMFQVLFHHLPGGSVRTAAALSLSILKISSTHLQKSLWPASPREIREPLIVFCCFLLIHSARTPSFNGNPANLLADDKVFFLEFFTLNVPRPRTGQGIRKDPNIQN